MAGQSDPGGYAINGIAPSTFLGLNFAQLVPLGSPQNLSEMTPAQIGGFPNITAFTAADTAAIPLNAISSISPALIGTLSASALSGFSPAAISEMSGAQIGALYNVQDMTTAQITAIQVGAVSSLSEGSIQELSANALSGFTPAQLAALTSAQVSALNLSDLDEAQLGALAPSQGVVELSANEDDDDRQIASTYNDSTVVNAGSGVAVYNAAGQLVTSSTPGVTELFTSSGTFAGLVGVDTSTGDLAVWDASGKEWDLQALLGTQEFQNAVSAAAGSTSDSNPFITAPTAALAVLAGQESALQSLNASSNSAVEQALSEDVVYGATAPISTANLVPLGDNNGNVLGYEGIDPGTGLFTVWNTQTGAVWNSNDPASAFVFSETQLSLGSDGAFNAMYLNYQNGIYPSDMNISAVQSDSGQIQGYVYFQNNGDVIAFGQNGVATDVTQEALQVFELLEPKSAISSLMNRRHPQSTTGSGYSQYNVPLYRPPSNGGGQANDSIGFELEIPNSGGQTITYAPFLPAGQTPPAADITKIVINPAYKPYIQAGNFAAVLEAFGKEGISKWIESVAEGLAGEVGSIVAQLLTGMNLLSPLSVAQGTESNYAELISAYLGGPGNVLTQEYSAQANTALPSSSQKFMDGTNVETVSNAQLVKGFLVGGNTPVLLSGTNANGAVTSLWTVASQIVSSGGVPLSGSTLEDKFALSFQPSTVIIGAVTGSGPLTFGVVGGNGTSNGGGIIINDPESSLTGEVTEPLASFVIPYNTGRSNGGGNI